jgi:ubiquinone/menaquinone biosynthesis C-methylase UbiE
MVSNTRRDCTEAVRKFSKAVNDVGGPILYVGTAGDPPGGEYAYLFNNKITTFDADSRWCPDIVGDITKTTFNDCSWDHIIMTQVIEHIPNIFDLSNEIYRILKPNGFLIIDCPWSYPYHAEPPSFGDYWRITKDGFRVLFPEHKFKCIEIISTENNTSCLFQKH